MYLLGRTPVTDYSVDGRKPRHTSLSLDNSDADFLKHVCKRGYVEGPGGFIIAPPPSWTKLINEKRLATIPGAAKGDKQTKPQQKTQSSDRYDRSRPPADPERRRKRPSSAAHARPSSSSTAVSWRFPADCVSHCGGYRPKSAGTSRNHTTNRLTAVTDGAEEKMRPFLSRTGPQDLDIRLRYRHLVSPLSTLPRHRF